MKQEILKALKEADGYLSGQELCEQLKVSRTAVWKAIQKLESEGYQIEAVRNRGYRLLNGADAYNEDEIRNALTSRWLGKPLRFLHEVDSTNNELRRMADQGALEGTLVIAGKQTAGKGRRGRTWISPEGTGVWMSFLLRPQFPPECASMLTLVAAMAVAEGIREVTGLQTGIKWPNDLVADGKKLCGILTEMSSDMDSIQYVIVGIGINTGRQEFAEEIRDTASSLELCSGSPADRVHLIDAVLRSWEKYYDVFLQTLDLSGLMEDYNQMLVNCGREVRVLNPKAEYRGTALGITKTGELQVRRLDGTVQNVMSGEVSVRGIYGYI